MGIIYYMLKSFYKNRKGIALMIASSIWACIGQLLWKISIEKDIRGLALGFLFYGIGALFMIIAYKFGKLSVLQPMLSLNYALSILLGLVILNEKITYQKNIGVLMIMFGVILIAGGDKE